MCFNKIRQENASEPSKLWPFKTKSCLNFYWIDFVWCCFIYFKTWFLEVYSGLEHCVDGWKKVFNFSYSFFYLPYAESISSHHCLIGCNTRKSRPFLLRQLCIRPVTPTITETTHMHRYLLIDLYYIKILIGDWSNVSEVREFPFLPKDQNWNPGTQIKWLTTSCNFSFLGFDTLFCLLWALAQRLHISHIYKYT